MKRVLIAWSLGGLAALASFFPDQAIICLLVALAVAFLVALIWMLSITGRTQ